MPDIRLFQKEDFSDWFRLRKLLWDRQSDDEHRSEMMDIYDHPETQLILIAEFDGKICGFLEASIRPFVEDCATDNVGYLEGWYVDSEFRRNGIGHALVETAEDWAREHGCTEMASDAEVGNEPSLQAHLACGYDETSRLVHLRKELF